MHLLPAIEFAASDTQSPGKEQLHEIHADAWGDNTDSSLVLSAKEQLLRKELNCISCIGSDSFFCVKYIYSNKHHQLFQLPFSTLAYMVREPRKQRFLAWRIAKESFMC